MAVFIVVKGPGEGRYLTCPTDKDILFESDSPAAHWIDGSTSRPDRRFDHLDGVAIRCDAHDQCRIVHSPPGEFVVYRGSSQRHRLDDLRDGDVIRYGDTVIVYTTKNLQRSDDVARYVHDVMTTDRSSTLDVMPSDVVYRQFTPTALPSGQSFGGSSRKSSSKKTSKIAKVVKESVQKKLTKKKSAKKKSVKKKTRSPDPTTEASAPPPPPPKPAASAPPMDTAATEYEETAPPDESSPAAEGGGWSAFPLVDCPTAVVVETAFVLHVGLAEEQQPEVHGDPLELPSLELGPYELDIDVCADGFRLDDRVGHARVALQISKDEPYPTIGINAQALSDAAFSGERSIMAMFSLHGRPVGVATRAVSVLPEGAAAPEPAELEPIPGLDERVFQADAPTVDLTISIVEGNRNEEGLLTWSLVSPHAVNLHPDADDARVTDIGKGAKAFAQEVYGDASQQEGEMLYHYLHGNGRGHIASQIPAFVADALRDVAAQVGGPPTVLLLSQEPYIPWELAVIEPPIVDDIPSPFFGAQAAIGRWIPGGRGRPPAEPPSGIVQIDSGAIISCDLYEHVRGFDELDGAIEEAKALREAHGHWSPVKGLLSSVMECLDGSPSAQLLHFAIHGVYEDSLDGTGLVLVAEQDDEQAPYRAVVLKDGSIRSFDLSEQPFVFLNACQVGAGNEVLGDYGGFVGGFLFSGARAVVAPLWKIDDDVACKIALGFYDGAFNGTPPAELIRRERARFDGTNHTSGTYLAYQFFGHPLMGLAAPKKTEVATDAEP